MRSNYFPTKNTNSKNKEKQTHLKHKSLNLTHFYKHYEVYEKEYKRKALDFKNYKIRMKSFEKQMHKKRDLEYTKDRIQNTTKLNVKKLLEKKRKDILEKVTNNKNPYNIKHEKKILANHGKNLEVKGFVQGTPRLIIKPIKKFDQRHKYFLDILKKMNLPPIENIGGLFNVADFDAAKETVNTNTKPQQNKTADTKAQTNSTNSNNKTNTNTKQPSVAAATAAVLPAENKSSEQKTLQQELSEASDSINNERNFLELLNVSDK